MRTINLLSISFFIAIFFISCKEIKKIESADIVDQQKSIEKKQDNNSLKETVQEFVVVTKSGLEGKKFYFIRENTDKEFILFRYSDDFEMKKYIFNKNKFINGNNVMEPSEWKVIEIAKQNSKIRYVVSMIGNNELIDTLNFDYNLTKGILKHTIRKGYKPITLIDSSKINTIKIVEKKFEE